MSDTKGTVVGSLVRIFRYPVKSMVGEELEQVHFTKTGILGMMTMKFKVTWEIWNIITSDMPINTGNMMGLIYGSENFWNIGSV